MWISVLLLIILLLLGICVDGLLLFAGFKNGCRLFVCVCVCVFVCVCQGIQRRPCLGLFRNEHPIIITRVVVVYGYK